MRSTHQEPFPIARAIYYAGVLFVALLLFRPALGVTASDFVFAVCVIALLLEAARMGFSLNTNLPPSLLVGMVVFAIGALVSSVLSEYVWDSLSVLLRFVYLIVVWFWLGSIVLRTREHLLRAIAFWVGSCAICSAVAIGQLVEPDLFPGALQFAGRMTGITSHPNDLGGLTSIAAVPALMLTTIQGISSRLRLMAYASVALILSGLLLSGSVSGFAAALAAATAWLVLGRIRLRYVMINAGWIGVVGTIVVLHFGLSPLQRLAITTADPYSANSTFFTRILSDELAWQRVIDNPLIGVGLDVNSQTAVAGAYVHNMLLGVWVEAGLLGLIGIAVIIGQIVVTSTKLVRGAADAQMRTPLVALVAATVGFIVLGFAQPILYQRFAWMPAALLFAARARGWAMRPSWRLPSSAIASGRQARRWG